MSSENFSWCAPKTSRTPALCRRWLSAARPQAAWLRLVAFPRFERIHLSLRTPRSFFLGKKISFLGSGIWNLSFDSICLLAPPVLDTSSAALRQDRVFELLLKWVLSFYLGSNGFAPDLVIPGPPWVPVPSNRPTKSRVWRQKEGGETKMPLVGGLSSPSKVGNGEKNKEKGNRE